jgi:zinc-ribbon domain
VAKCSTCGASLAKKARYCPQCGTPVERGDTEVLETPAAETGPVPVNVTRAEPRFYGVTPVYLTLGLAVATLAVTIVLFATGHWQVALILFGVTILLALAFLEALRRKPEAAAFRSTADAFRDRAGFAAEALATRGRAATRVLAARRELQRLGQDRRRLLVELGEAVYRGDTEAIETARSRVEELDRLAEQREAEMREMLESTRQRLVRRRLEVQSTQVVEPQPEPETPAPGEGNPPEPARIPEPYPPPDEGTPPQPAIIPEPEPAVIPEPGPQGQEKDT